MDDVHTYSFLTSQISLPKQSVVLISLEPYELAHRLSDQLQSNHVLAMSASWHHLARAICTRGECKKHHSVVRLPFCVPCVLYRYEALLDAG